MSERTIALVTGANKGIGYEIAAGLGALGWSVGVGARDEQRRQAAVDKLRAAGVEALLQVWEGQSHAQYLRDINAPETKEYHDEIARFFDLHLGQ